MNTDKLAVALGFENKHIMKRFFDLYPEEYVQIKNLRSRTYDQWFSSFTAEAALIVNLTLDNARVSLNTFNTATTKLHKDIEHSVKVYTTSLPNYNDIPYVLPLPEQDLPMHIDSLSLD